MRVVIYPPRDWIGAESKDECSDGLADLGVAGNRCYTWFRVHRSGRWSRREETAFHDCTPFAVFSHKAAGQAHGTGISKGSNDERCPTTLGVLRDQIRSVGSARERCTDCLFQAANGRELACNA